MTTTIVIHLPSHRRRALQIERNTAEAEQAYDAQIGGYVEFLRHEARHAGYRIETDQRDDGPPFGIVEDDGVQKREAHHWLDRQPDIWNWMP